jgi:hypothetical protein
MYDRELYKSDILYRFFSNRILGLEYEIRDNAAAIEKLAKKQAELKRGKAELVKLRRELKQRITANIRH